MSNCSAVTPCSVPADCEIMSPNDDLIAEDVREHGNPSGS